MTLCDQGDHGVKPWPNPSSRMFRWEGRRDGDRPVDRRRIVYKLGQHEGGDLVGGVKQAVIW
jgi:hypothetical protein